MNVLSLFAGIGGLDLGLQRAGMTIVGQVEIDPFCQQVLAQHWPEVPRYDDVRTTTTWWRSRQRPPIDVVAGGLPCQPVSLVGRGRAQQDPRWLWPAMLDVVAGLQPEWVLFENVPGLRTRGLAIIHTDLEALGYHVRTGVASACAVGAPFMRKRLFGVAHAPSLRRGTRRTGRPSGDAPYGPNQPSEGMAGSTSAGETAGHWAREPRVARLAHGIPAGLVEHACRAYGNAVVPQVAEYVGQLIINEAY